MTSQWSMTNQCSTNSNKCTFLVHGYTRSLQRILHRTIPSSITQLCFDFYFVSDPFQYEWTIQNKQTIDLMKNAANQAMWQSPTISMYGFKWHICIFPCGVTIKSDQNVSFRFVLEALPPNIHSIHISTKFSFIQANVHFITATVKLSRDKLYSAWQSSRLKTIDIQKYDIFTFKVQPQLIAVFDANLNDMRHQYLNCDMFELCNDFKYMTQAEKINDMINNKLDYIINKIDLIEQRLNKIENNNNDCMYNGHEKVKQWLEMDVGLPQYYNMFMDNGFENLSIVSLLNIHTIQAIGVDKIGHQLKILTQVNKLKQNKI